MKLKILSILLFLLPIPILAGTVVYTDNQHLPGNLPSGVTVIFLDSPERLQTQMFSQLSADPKQAELQAQRVMSSNEWHQAEQKLVASYWDVIHAWELGIKKIPAVVFDERDVVYGTTDVAHALTLRNLEGRE
ncbi:TIGR03757 family integrating conjugative element protein [Pantoea cypripedii]|uniref:TIGR03757 family integrating conjugative element protein n=1 Tax=Pantoea cypripedii TaxID=55209 RepID=UPI002FC93778